MARNPRLLGVLAAAALVAGLSAAAPVASAKGGDSIFPLAEHWDGTSWTQTPLPQPGSPGGALTGVTALPSGDAWAVSLDGTADHWNGSAWNAVELPSPKGASTNVQGGGVLPFAIASRSAHDVWVVGSWDNPETGGEGTLVEHWNGTSWKVVRSPTPRFSFAWLYGVSALSVKDAWAVGAYTNDVGENRTLVLHWNGTKWRRVPSPNPSRTARGDELTGIAVVSGRSAWAVGDYRRAHRTRTLVVHWNGTRWRHVRSPTPWRGGWLYGIASAGRNDAWAVGAYGAAQGSTPLVEHWNGRHWTAVAMPPAGGDTGQQVLTGIAAPSRKDIWAAGASPASGSQPTQTLLEHFDGSGWSASSIPVANANAGLSGIAAVSRDDVWAVGASYSNG
jgi:hypothetical protein